MDAITLLKDDHQKVKKLFRDFESAGERDFAKQQQIVQQACTELEIHSQLEEELFYPAVKARADHEGKELVAESNEEHHVVDVLIAELKKVKPQDEAFRAKFTVLMENVEHHIEEEESELFPRAQQLLGTELDQIGTKMQQRKKQLMSSAR